MVPWCAGLHFNVNRGGVFSLFSKHKALISCLLSNFEITEMISVGTFRILSMNAGNYIWMSQQA